MIREALDGETIFAIREFLGPEECDQLIALSESIGYQAAGLGDEVVLQLRNNGRAFLEDRDLAAKLWHKARPFLSARREGWEACGLHERFRFYRYEAAEMFAPHYDGCVSRGEDEVSQLTFMIYLNGECEGGETRFYQRNAVLRFEVAPERGKALIFEHAQMHEGAPVVAGRKYVLRTDVMYRRGVKGGAVGAEALDAERTR